MLQIEKCSALNGNCSYNVCAQLLTFEAKLINGYWKSTPCLRNLCFYNFLGGRYASAHTVWEWKREKLDKDGGTGGEVKREESDKDGGTAYSVMSTCGLLTTFPMVCLGPSFKLNLPLPSVNVNCGVT